MKYPNLIIRLDYIENNARAVADACRAMSVDVCGIVKGVHCDPEVAKAFVRGGVSQVGDARIENLERLRMSGVEAPLLLTRVPMLSEVERIVKSADISLNSELTTVDAINAACHKHGRRHKVILMCDLGDLREGIMDRHAILEAACAIEALEHVELAGVGTNLGCYGAVKPTVENLGTLVKIAEAVEARIGRRLEFVSGGATSSLPLVYDGTLPERVNHLRIGEAILLARDLPEIWKVDLPGTRMDTVVVEAQIVELKSKPSHPVGELFIDAFGNKPEFDDRGLEYRAILALGKQDFAYMDQLIPRDSRVKLIGSSSDHLITSVPDMENYKVGDILQFEMYYGPMLFLSGAAHIQKTHIK